MMEMGLWISDDDKENGQILLLTRDDSLYTTYKYEMSIEGDVFHPSRLDFTKNFHEKITFFFPLLL
jgi:hypothetical protein